MHFVELVGVTSPDDVVGEVGSALGVRDSVERPADAHARAAHRRPRPDRAGRSTQAPTLLILDNCEHVVEAVADLVAFLVATCPRLRVLTTTRAPLGDRRRAGLPARRSSTTTTAAELFGAARRGRPARRRASTPTRC